MHVFVTVGSTKFDSLIQTVLLPSTLAAFHRKGYRTLDIQCGNSTFASREEPGMQDSLQLTKEGLEISIWRFKPTLEQEFRAADLVVSHAGSGTIIEVLRIGKPLLVVPNPTLLDNHQQELADALQALGHLKFASVSDLASVVDNFDPSALIPFPAFDGSKFRSIMDATMGFM